MQEDVLLGTDLRKVAEVIQRKMNSGVLVRVTQ